MLSITGNSISDVWEELLHELLGASVASPRGLPIREHRNVTLCIESARNNILISPQRKPNYRFMVAEWLWIWFGRDDVASIARYNPKIAEFSDDGVRFAGAYGPKIRGQWDRAVNQLRSDGDTRQAVIDIFSVDALGTKDVACTLALQFMIRNGRLHTTAYMRSSDVWLGLPYDTFTFAMLGNIMAAQTETEVGSLTFHLGSSHLYERDAPAAGLVLMAREATTMNSPILEGKPPDYMNAALEDPQKLAMAHYNVPWSMYIGALASQNSGHALICLRGARDAVAAIE